MSWLGTEWLEEWAILGRFAISALSSRGFLVEETGNLKVVSAKAGPRR